MASLVKLFKLLVSSGDVLLILNVAVVWLGLNILCWILGAIGLRTLGRKAEVYPLYTAWFPNGQIYYTLRLNHKERLARRTAWLIWWSLVLVAIGAVCLIWAAVFHLQPDQAFLSNLLIIVACFALVLALIFYIGIRMLEFQALRRLLNNKAMVAISALGTIFAIPLQRIFLFFIRNR